MRVDERPRPLQLAVLLFVLPTVLTGCAVAVYWADKVPGQVLDAPWIARAVLSILLVAVPGAVLASRSHKPGIALFVLALVPAAIGIGAPMIRHQGLASPIWMGDMLLREAYGAMRGGWESVMTGALLSAALCAWYGGLVGVWPVARSRKAELWGAGRQRIPLLIAGPAASALCALAWRLAGVRPLASDLGVWIVACGPALLFAAGDRSARFRRDVLHMLAAFAGCILLLALAGHARAMCAATLRPPDPVEPSALLNSAIVRDTLLRWVLAALSAAFGVLALVPGRIRLRSHRRLHWTTASAWGLIGAVVGAGGLLPDVRTMQELRASHAAWENLLRSRNIQLPRCAGAASRLMPGPLVLVPATGEAHMLGVAGGGPNVAVSGDSPLAAVLAALSGIGPQAGSEAALLVIGCGHAAGSGGWSGFSDLRAVPMRTAPGVECAGGADTLIVMLEDGGARVLRNGCSAAAGIPEWMAAGELWREASGKKVFAGVAAGVSVSSFLALTADPGAASATLVLDGSAVRAVLDRAAMRQMLVDPGPRGPWKGTLALERLSYAGAQLEHPESVYAAIRGQAGLLACFESVTRERHWKAHFEIAAGGQVTVGGGEKDEPGAACVAEGLQAMVVHGAQQGAYEAVLGWYPAPPSAPDAPLPVGVLRVGAEADTGGMRGADALGARLSPYFARCVAEAMQSEPELAGTAHIKVCIQSDGALEPSAGESSRIPLSALDCMRSAVRLVRAEADYAIAGQTACFRVNVWVKSPAEVKTWHLEVSVQEPDREAALKRESGETENTFRAVQASRDVLTCFGRPFDAPEQQGEVRLSLKPNRSGHVMGVTAETSGVVDARLTRCAADTYNRLVLHVDPEWTSPPRIGVTLKVSTSTAP